MRQEEGSLEHTCDLGIQSPQGPRAPLGLPTLATIHITSKLHPHTLGGSFVEGPSVPSIAPGHGGKAGEQTPALQSQKIGCRSIYKSVGTIAAAHSTAGVAWWQCKHLGS